MEQQKKKTADSKKNVIAKKKKIYYKTPRLEKLKGLGVADGACAASSVCLATGSIA